MSTFRELKERVEFLSDLLSEQDHKLTELRQKAAADYEHLSGTIRYLREANRELGMTQSFYAERYNELLLKTGETGSTRGCQPAPQGGAGELRYAN